VLGSSQVLRLSVSQNESDDSEIDANYDKNQYTTNKKDLERQKNTYTHIFYLNKS